MPKYLTLSEENQAVFECPTVGAKSKVAQCMKLREMVWMGTQIDKRHACKVAMKCSMCPAAAIVKNISMAGQQPVSDDYGSTEPRVVKIHANVLERIKNTLPITSVLDRAPLSPEERQRLLTSRQRIEEQLKTAPGRNGKSTPFVAPTKVDSAFSPSKSVGRRGRIEDEHDREDVIPMSRVSKTNRNETINKAALTGDMTAAINAAA